MDANKLKTLLVQATEIMDEFYMAYDDANYYSGRVVWDNFPSISMELNEFREYNLWHNGDEYSLAEVTTWADLGEVVVLTGVITQEELDAALAL